MLLGASKMSNNEKKRLDSGHVLGFVAVVLTAFYAFRLFSHFGSIQYELVGLIASRIVMPHMIFVVVALFFSVIGLFEQKRWCMLVACVLMGISALFMLDYTRYIAVPALFLFFAYVEMG